VRLLVVLLALAASAPVPWIDRQPVKASAHPPLAAPCRASQLGSRLYLQGATGSLVGGVDLANDGARACALLGRPVVSFVGASRPVMVLAAAPQKGPDDALVDPPGSLRALAPGKRASVSLWWSNWCGRGGRAPTAIRLGLPDGTAVVLPLQRAPRCDDRHAPSTIQVGPFQPALRHLGPSSRLPLTVAILGMRPAHVKPGVRAFRARSGTIFRYVVALTNTGSKPFSFGSTCPVYEESLQWPRVQAYVLNCRPAGSIASHRTVRFAMQLHVPRPSRSGFDLLTWQLAPTTYLAPDASADVRVVG
jgi:hypothetical protein